MNVTHSGASTQRNAADQQARAVRDVCQLGYSEAESTFLYRVAGAGGYFVRRQFLACTGHCDGRAVVDFTRRLEARRHASVLQLKRGTHVYHLSSRALYAAAACEDRKRARRRRPDISIRIRLMALDVMLGHPDVAFLVTDDDRVACLTGLLNGKDYLPRRTFKARNGATGSRAFVDNVMIGVETRGGALRPVLVYLDAGSARVLGFRGLLKRYEDLLGRLDGWRLLHVSDASRGGMKAARDYSEWAQAVDRERRDARLVEEVLTYFRLRRLWEEKRYKELTTETVYWFVDNRARVASHADEFYELWLQSGDASVRDLLAVSGKASFSAAGSFEAVVLPYSYPFDPCL
jgi:hypothetical protein